MLNRLFPRLPLERILMFVSLALGLLHAWLGRYSMNPDGMSYLDVGDSFFRLDWANAVNAWWSPLYPWTLGLVVGLAKPSPRWEFPLAHLVNFGVFVAALFAFRFLLDALVAFGREQNSKAPPNDAHVLPEWALILLAYAIFWWTALEVETLYDVSPDLVVMACVCLTAAMLLRLRPTDRHWKFVLFGLILGIGYWTKAILFPLGFVTLGVGYLWKRSIPAWGRRITVASLVFLCSCAPLIFLLSHEKGRFTFGDSGRGTMRGMYLPGRFGGTGKEKSLVVEHPFIPRASCCDTLRSLSSTVPWSALIRPGPTLHIGMRGYIRTSS